MVKVLIVFTLFYFTSVIYRSYKICVLANVCVCVCVSLDETRTLVGGQQTLLIRKRTHNPVKTSESTVTVY